MNIKKRLSLLLCLTVLICTLSGCFASEPEGMLCSPIDLSSWQKENKSEIMDFAYYMADELGVGGDSGYSRRFDWSEDKKYILEDYIELLCTEYDFEQVGQTYDNSGFFDVVLRYTGENQSPDQNLTGTFSNNAGDVVIWYSTKYGDIEGYILCDDGLAVGDDGYRHGKSEQVCTLSGDSAGAGLGYYDGAFCTSDGRLATPVNRAVMLIDGKPTYYSAHYEISSSGDRFTVRVEDDYGNDIQVFYIPSLIGWRDGFTPASNFAIEADYVVNRGGVMESFPTYTWKTMFTTLHNYQYVVPSKGLAGEMSGLTFRVMFQTEKVIVFYTCATFRSSPSVTEALIAVNIDVEFDGAATQSPSGAGDLFGKNCSTCSGSGNCGQCGGSGKVNEWVGDQYMYLNCTRCGATGNCPSCYGSGKK